MFSTLTWTNNGYVEHITWWAAEFNWQLWPIRKHNEIFGKNLKSCLRSKSSLFCCCLFCPGNDLIFSSSLFSMVYKNGAGVLDVLWSVVVVCFRVSTFSKTTSSDCWVSCRQANSTWIRPQRCVATSFSKLHACFASSVTDCLTLQYLAVTCGLVRGALSNLGVRSIVTAEASVMPACKTSFALRFLSCCGFNLSHNTNCFLCSCLVHACR